MSCSNPSWISSILICFILRASRVDVKKLEKQEAKLKVCYSSPQILGRLAHVFKAKIEKRARRDLYEGSKLLDAYKKQVFTFLTFLFKP